MNRLTAKLLLAFSLQFCLVLSALSQAGSPFTRFGLGDIRPSTFSNNRMMGHIAAGVGARSYINHANPASYADLLVTTFDVGAMADINQLETADSSYKGGNGSFSHIAFGFPVKTDKAGLSFGLIPYSYINYDFVNRLSNNEVGDYAELYEGKGNIYQAYAGSGVKFGDFYVGANIGLLFGKQDASENIVFSNPLNFFNSRKFDQIKYNGFSYTLGMQYKRKIKMNINDIDANKKNNLYFSVGAFGSSQTNLNSNSTSIWQRYQVINSTLYIKDTIGATGATKSKILIPGQFTVGGTVFEPGRWMAGMDFFWQHTSNLTYNTSNQAFADRWSFKLGGEFSPKRENPTTNQRRKGMIYSMVYRAGLFAGKSEYLINNQHATEYGITFGLSIPIKRSLSWINLGFEYGSIGRNLNNFVQEKYYRLTASFNLNDKWFYKPKFD